jgi:LmbE family N-acetylglucosaminyl deacetylase
MYASRRSWVATVTASEGGMANVSALVPAAHASAWYARLRVWDSLTVPQLGGVPRERCLNLVYPAGRLRDMHARPAEGVVLGCEETLARAALRARNARPEFQGGGPTCSWRDLVEDLRKLLLAANPGIVVCPHPLVDGHPDHVFTTVAVEEAARAVPRADRLFMLYVVHRADVAAYPFGPATAVASLPPWTDAQWVADSIYSHPLPEEVRLAKYFAVEANHDLRRYDAAERRTLRQVVTAARREAGAWIAGTELPAGTFLRRAPRPNELYCVVSASSLAELVARALAG